jgi:histidyl-tRNA synthetase
MRYSRAKGVFDSFPESSWKSSHYFHWLIAELEKIATAFGFHEIITPIFEKTELFIRTSGETSDIVSKEMFVFEDKGGRQMALRPEGTAPAMRAYIENHLEQNKKAQKLFYIGPYFRYDRPQAGRYRQFHQFGAEAIGVKDPLQDVEIIHLLMECYKKIGLKNLSVTMNCLGDLDARKAYTESLKDYLGQYLPELSEESQIRFEKNPLRILDSKNPKDREILQNSPRLIDFLSSESESSFSYILGQLNSLRINTIVDPRLVRGLDYYNETVFEVITQDLGAQSTIGAGGRYDSLLKMLDGPDLPSVGFATGLERILQTLEVQQSLPHLSTDLFAYFIPLDEAAKLEAYKYVTQLRHQGITSDLYLRGKKLQKALQYAHELGIRYVIILGETELKEQTIKIKEMSTGAEQSLPLHSLVSTLHHLWSTHVRL